MFANHRLLRELMLHIRTLVDKMFPNMTHAIVGGFIFLRYICPAILSPSKIGHSPFSTIFSRPRKFLTKISSIPWNSQNVGIPRPVSAF